MEKHKEFTVEELYELIKEHKTNLILEKDPTRIKSIEREIKRLESLLGGDLDFESLSKNSREQIERDFYYRLNREMQGNDFDFFLSEHAGFEKPILCFLHGFHEDRHNGLVQRFNEKLKEAFKKEPFFVSLDEWVNYAEKDKTKLQFLLKKKITENLENQAKSKKISIEMPRAFDNCKFLHDLPTLAKYMLSFEINVYVKYWNSDILNVLNEYLLGKLFNFELTDKERPVFFFVNLIYEPEAKGIKALFGSKNKKVETEIEDFCKKNEKQTLLLKKLTKIDYNHAHSFFSNQKFGIFNWKEIIKEDEELTFDEFFSRCADKIAHFYVHQKSVI